MTAWIKTCPAVYTDNGIHKFPCSIIIVFLFTTFISPYIRFYYILLFPTTFLFYVLSIFSKHSNIAILKLALHCIIAEMLHPTSSVETNIHPIATGAKICSNLLLRAKLRALYQCHMHWSSFSVGHMLKIEGLYTIDILDEHKSRSLQEWAEVNRLWDGKQRFVERELHIVYSAGHICRF